MAMNWSVEGKTADVIRQSIDAALNQMGIPSFAQVGWEKDELCVRIDKAGKSEFRMRLKTDGSKIKIEETKRDISFMHKPFVGKVESFVEQVMNTVGAKKA